MADRSRTLAGPVLLLLLVVGLVAAHRSHGRVALVQQGRVEGRISAAERAATLTFAPDTSDYDRRAVLTAVAHARPQARRLVEDVDGLVTIRIAQAGEHAVGLTQSEGSRFDVTLNLGEAARVAGQRGIDRLVLHELGHVVDFALVPDAVVAQLDAEVPTRYGCTDGVTGACTNDAEVFAETFAKWATGDIGINLDLGYAVPPPPDLEAWGKPLAAVPGA